MSYEYYPGSVFECAENKHIDTLVNTVNCKGFMGAGLALEFKLRFPEMFADYEAKCARSLINVGELDFFEGPIQILNFPTKNDWKQPSKLQWIELGLRTFRECYRSLGIKSVAFPKLGTNNGGLNWTDVKALMERYLMDLEDLQVFVCMDDKEPEGTEAKMLQILNNLTQEELREIGLRASAIESIRNGLPVKRFFMLGGLNGIGTKTYEALHQYCYTIASKNHQVRDRGSEGQQLTLF